MLSSLTDKLVYPAPTPTYTAKDLEGCLCWLPWNEAIPTPPAIRPEGPNLSRFSVGCPSQQRGGSCSSDCTAKALPCLWLPAKRSANVIFYFHANAEDLGVVHSALVHLQKQLQVNVLAIEYPGYGLLKDQTPSEDSICGAALVALRYIVSEVGFSYNQVMLLGRSLGSGPAVYLASRFPVGGLLLVNPFASLRGAAECHVGKALSRIAFQDHFKNEDVIGNVSCAVLFIHAARDRTVPMEHSARLFKKCRSRKLLITPEGMEHNSHLFADPTYLAVPAIHFFHFPCYQTEKPPTLPPQVFKPPAPRPPWRPTDCRKSPWACSGTGCIAPNSGRGENPDEVAVPADAALLGQVDINETGTPRNFGASASGSIAREVIVDTPNKASASAVEQNPEATPGFEQRSVLPSMPSQVAPGDESAGWPGPGTMEKPPAAHRGEDPPDLDQSAFRSEI